MMAGQSDGVDKVEFVARYDLKSISLILYYALISAYFLWVMPNLLFERLSDPARSSFEFSFDFVFSLIVIAIILMQSKKLFELVWVATIYRNLVYRVSETGISSRAINSYIPWTAVKSARIGEVGSRFQIVLQIDDSQVQLRRPVLWVRNWIDLKTTESGQTELSLSSRAHGLSPAKLYAVIKRYASTIRDEHLFSPADENEKGEIRFSKPDLVGKFTKQRFMLGILLALFLVISAGFLMNSAYSLFDMLVLKPSKPTPTFSWFVLMPVFLLLIFMIVAAFAAASLMLILARNNYVLFSIAAEGLQLIESNGTIPWEDVETVRLGKSQWGDALIVSMTESGIQRFKKSSSLTGVLFSKLNKKKREIAISAEGADVTFAQLWAAIKRYKPIVFEANA